MELPLRTKALHLDIDARWQGGGGRPALPTSGGAFPVSTAPLGHIATSSSAANAAAAAGAAGREVGGISPYGLHGR